ncbi:MFS transporter [Kitasatospora sp. NPDC085879]|uniref:MFS transporter n=1 Tax=Kitasatospora sp. NPDC085879 TaxID=3154769 RepID=UPI00342394B4
MSAPAVTRPAEDLPAPPPPLGRNRDYRMVWTGSAVSALGSSITSLAYPLLVLAATGSPTKAGLVGFANTLPNLALPLHAGVLVDRFDRKKLLILCDAVRALCLGSVGAALLLGHFWLWHVLTVCLIEGAFTVLAGIAGQAAIRNVVRREDLDRAFARSEARDRAAMVVGKPLGGLLLGVTRSLPFLADAASYLVSLAALLLVRRPFQTARTERPAEARQSAAAEIKEGVRWVLSQPFVRIASLLVAGSNLLFQALFLAVIVLLHQAHASDTAIGYVLAAAGVGGAAGSFCATWFRRRLPLAVVVIGANWIWALLVPLVGLTRSPLVIGATVAGLAFVGPVWNVAVEVYRLTITPDEIQGRTTSAVTLVAFGALPLGSLAGGLMLSHLSGRATVLWLSALMVLLALAATASKGVRTVAVPGRGHVRQEDTR